MDHYIPKRRIPVVLSCLDPREAEAHLFLDLDPSGKCHQTILSKLNESSRFLPAAVGEELRIHLFLKSHIVRVTAAAPAIAADVYTRGFQPWREEMAEVWLSDGAHLQGRLWMPLERPSQRVSDYMNQGGWSFFVLHSGESIQLVNTRAVVRMALAETADDPLETARAGAGQGSPTMAISRVMPMPAFDPTLGLGSTARH